MSLGLRYAGTLDESVAELLSSELNKLKRCKFQILGGPVEFTDSNKNNVEKHALYTVICSTLLAISLVMAGSGHIPTLRLIKQIRK